MKKKTTNILISILFIIVVGLIVYIKLFNEKTEIASIRLSKDIINIYVGESERLIILPENAIYDELIWISEDELIASVSEGLVKGNKVGNTIIDLYSNGEIIDRCIVKVSEKQTNIPSPPVDDPVQIDPIQKDPIEQDPVEKDPSVEKQVTNYTIKYYGATIIETGLNSLTINSNDSNPLVSSNNLSLSTNTLYIVSFDYKTVSGTNTFNVDLNPDDLPEKILTASVFNQHYDWELSSNSNNMRNCKLRFFDNQRGIGERDIIINNVMFGTIKSNIKKQGDIIGTMPTPIRNGYTFLGWYTAREGGTKVTSSTKVTKSMILYPHWSEKVKILPNEYIVPSGYSLVPNGVYNSETLKYKTIKKNDSKVNRYYSLIYVKDANRQINSANNYLRGEQRQVLLNSEITNQNLKAKGMIATNGSFSISDRSNTPVIASKGNITINNRYSTKYVYGTLTIGADNMLKQYITKNTNTLTNWLKGVGARNTWAVTHFEQSNWNGGTDGGADYRTSICQVDSHNFVLYVGYSLGIHDYMKELHSMFGCTIVSNLDGGGSSGMYYKTKGMSKVGVIYEYKRPNDCCRVIGDMLYFTE